MAGLTEIEMSSWRIEAKQYLSEFGLAVMDPCAVDKFTRPIELVTSNKFMIDQSALVLAEFQHREPSIGTICEVVYAREKGKPVIAWGSNPALDHPWMRALITRSLYSLEEALMYIVRNYYPQLS